MSSPTFSGGYVQLPTIPSSSSGGPFAQSWSVEIWAYFSSWPSANTRLFDLGAGAGASNIITAFQTSNMYAAVYSATTSSFWNLASPSTGS